ncbi:MAG: hypothetical protein HY763_12155 [Planctomycetes bacterium]|nr:hypothetical protein [Planctomycetota bacterium]
MPAGGDIAGARAPLAMVREFTLALPEPTRAYLESGAIADASDASEVDPSLMESAQECSAKWVEAIIRAEHVPDDLRRHIVGVRNAVNGRDATRADFERGGLRFVVVQTTDGLVAVIRPAGASTDAGSVTDRLRFLGERISATLNHAPAILYLADRAEETEAMAAISRGDRLRNERGVPLSDAEHLRIAKLPQPEQAEVIQKLTQQDEEALRRLDRSLPATLVGGAQNYWWGQVHAASDGFTVVVSIQKSHGGAARTVVIEDWFRKQRLVSPGARAMAPLPPQ